MKKISWMLLCVIFITSCTKSKNSNCINPFSESLEQAKTLYKSGSGIKEIAGSLIENFDATKLTRDNIECSLFDSFEANKKLIDEYSSKAKNSELYKLGEQKFIQSLENQIKIDDQLASYLTTLSALYYAVQKDLFPYVKEQVVALYNDIQKTLTKENENEKLEVLKNKVPLILKDIKSAKNQQI